MTGLVSTQDAYGRGPVTRLLTPVRGLIRPGNSGGPVLDDAGAVLTTVFAATTGAGPNGGYGVANRRSQRASGAPADLCRRSPARDRSRRPVAATAGRRSAGPCSARYAADDDGHDQDTRNRREAVGRARPGARAARPVRQARGLPRGAGARDHAGRSATSCSSPSPTSTTRSSSAGGWPTCRSCPSTSSSSSATSARASRCRSSSAQLHRADVNEVINACDAGREGELIFAYVFEKAGAKLPVQRLWLSSMTSAAMRSAFAALRPGVGAGAARAGGSLALGGRLDRRHERDPRGHDPAALVLRRRRLARPRADADARDHRAPRGGDPRVHAGAVLARRCPLRALGRRRTPLRRPLSRRRQAAPRDRGGGARDRRRGARRQRRDHEGREARGHRARRRCSTTSRRFSATPTRASASRRDARSRPRSGSTRSTRRSPIRARARAS